MLIRIFFFGNADSDACYPDADPGVTLFKDRSLILCQMYAFVLCLIHFFLTYYPPSPPKNPTKLKS